MTKKLWVRCCVLGVLAFACCVLITNFRDAPSLLLLFRTAVGTDHSNRLARTSHLRHDALATSDSLSSGSNERRRAPAAITDRRDGEEAEAEEAEAEETDEEEAEVEESEVEESEEAEVEESEAEVEQAEVKEVKVAEEANGAEEADDEFLPRMEALQRTRQARLRAACNSSSLMTGNQGTVFNLDSLGLTYCCIAKCASTTFKVFLDRTTGNRCGKRNIHVCTASMFPRAASPAHFLPNSVLIVRDPWERLVSAYTNKFVEERNIIAESCYEHHNKTLRGRTPLTFAEFAECILDRVDSRGELNGHVAPISWHCSPCRNKYTYIATLETFGDDLDYLIKAVLPRTKTPDEYWKAINSVKRRKSEESNTTQLTYDKNYGSLSNRVLERLVDIYKADAMLYGYAAHPLDS